MCGSSRSFPTGTARILRRDDVPDGVFGLTFGGMPPYNLRKGKEHAMAGSTISSKGQTTVPAEVRAALHAEPGTRLAWHVTPDGDVIVRAKTSSILDLAGSVKTNKHVDVEAMNPWTS